MITIWSINAKKVGINIKILNLIIKIQIREFKQNSKANVDQSYETIEKKQ